jgi:hypothetical protein
MPIRTVLIVDPELGFVFWLGQALDRAGYQALPAKSCEDAAELLKQLNVEIDLLIVGHSLAGAGAFADALRHAQGHLSCLRDRRWGRAQRRIPEPMPQFYAFQCGRSWKRNGWRRSKTFLAGMMRRVRS